MYVSPEEVYFLPPAFMKEAKYLHLLFALRDTNLGTRDFLFSHHGNKFGDFGFTNSSRNIGGQFCSHGLRAYGHFGTILEVCS